MGSKQNESQLLGHRYRAYLALNRSSIAQLARSLHRWSPRHLAFVLDGQRQPSAELGAALRNAIAPDVWAWVCGKTDVLRDTTPTVEAQP